MLLTTDKNIRYQQNLKARTLAIVVLEYAQWPMVKLVAATISDEVDKSSPGGFVEVAVPFVD